MKEYKTLEMDLIECFEKRNIRVKEIQITEEATKYLIIVQR